MPPYHLIRAVFTACFAAILMATAAHAQNEPWRAVNIEAATLLRAGKHVEALALAERSLAMCDNAGPTDFLCRAIFHENIAESVEALGQVDRAEAEYKQFLEIREHGLPPGHPLIAEPLLRLGWSTKGEASGTIRCHI